MTSDTWPNYSTAQAKVQSLKKEVNTKFHRHTRTHRTQNKHNTVPHLCMSIRRMPTTTQRKTFLHSYKSHPTQTKQFTLILISTSNRPTSNSNDQRQRKNPPTPPTHHRANNQLGMCNVRTEEPGGLVVTGCSKTLPWACPIETYSPKPSYPSTLTLPFRQYCVFTQQLLRLECGRCGDGILGGGGACRRGVSARRPQGTDRSPFAM